MEQHKHCWCILWMASWRCQSTLQSEKICLCLIQPLLFWQSATWELSLEKLHHPPQSLWWTCRWGQEESLTNSSSTLQNGCTPAPLLGDSVWPPHLPQCNRHAWHKHHQWGVREELHHLVWLFHGEQFWRHLSGKRQCWDQLPGDHEWGEGRES